MTTGASQIPAHAGFDHATSTRLAGDPFAGWSSLRAAAPAFSSDIGGSYTLWYLLGHDDVRAAFQNHELFSSRCVQYVGHSPQSMIPEELDPPEHAKYRRLLNTPLAPNAVRAMEHSIRTHCAELVETVAARGHCDFLTDIAQRFPTEVFMRLMGLPVEMTGPFMQRAHDLLHTSADQDPDFSIRKLAAAEIVRDIAEAVADHRGNPREDMITHLLGSTVDGRPLSDMELARIGFLLYTAGLDTVANVLTFTFHHLALHPDLRRRMAAEPALLPSAVEEFLRYYSIVTVARVVTRDVEFAGCPMRAGDRVVLPTPSTARDEAQFPGPDTFDPARTPNRHLAFGAGPHRCAGSHLARLELRIALEEWHRLIPDYDISPGADIDTYSGIVAGLTALPLRWG